MGNSSNGLIGLDMTDLTNTEPYQNYGDLLTTTNNGDGLVAAFNPLQDGLGNDSTIQISTAGVNFTVDIGHTFELNGVPLTATPAALNALAETNTFTAMVPLQVPRLFYPVLNPPVQNGAIYYNTAVDVFRKCVGNVWLDF